MLQVSLIDKWLDISDKGCREIQVLGISLIYNFAETIYHNNYLLK